MPNGRAVRVRISRAVDAISSGVMYAAPMNPSPPASLTAPTSAGGVALAPPIGA
jgi:hypothetical protein